MRLFICYAHEDKPQVRQIIEILQAGGHETWFDYRLLPGQDWQTELLKSIQGSDAFIYVLTPESVVSSWCQWEFRQAVHLGKPVVPVLLQKKTKILKELQPYQYADFTDGPTPEATARLLAGLLSAVKVPREDVPLPYTIPPGNPSQAALAAPRQRIPWQGLLVIGAVLAVVLFAGALLVNALSSLAAPVPTITPSASPAPTLTATPSPTDAPTTTPQPTVTIAPLSARPSPDAFVRQYYETLEAKGYEAAWNMLSGWFQQNKTGGWSEFLDWWRDSVYHIVIQDVRPVSESASEATAYIRLCYYYTVAETGEHIVRRQELNVDLIFNINTDAWLYRDAHTINDIVGEC